MSKIRPARHNGRRGYYKSDKVAKKQLVAQAIAICNGYPVHLKTNLKPDYRCTVYAISGLGQFQVCVSTRYNDKLYDIDNAYMYDTAEDLPAVLRERLAVLYIADPVFTDAQHMQDLFGANNYIDRLLEKSYIPAVGVRVAEEVFLVDLGKELSPFELAPNKC